MTQGLRTERTAETPYVTDKVSADVLWGRIKNAWGDGPKAVDLFDEIVSAEIGDDCGRDSYLGSLPLQRNPGDTLVELGD